MADTLAQALVAAQAEMPSVPKRGLNPHYKNAYVTLDDLLDEVRPLLNKHGLAVIQAPDALEDGTPALTTTIVHGPTGDRVESTMPLVLAKQDMQGLGAAITYGRRYMLTAMFGIAESTDDDGHQASRPPDRRVDPEVPVPKTAAEVEALWDANGLDLEWLKQARKHKPSVQKMATATVRLLSMEPAEPFGYSREQIQAEFAAVLDGVVLDGPAQMSDEELNEMRRKVGATVPGEDPSIPFGDPT